MVGIFGGSAANSSVLQPAQLRRDGGGKAVAVQFNPTRPLAGAEVHAWSAGRARDRIAGQAPRAPRLAELNVAAAAPHPLTSDSARATAIINRTINFIGERRALVGDTPLTATLQAQLHLLQDGYETLSSGPMVGDGLLQAIDDVEARLRAINTGKDALAEQVRATAPSLKVVAQLVEDLQELSDAVSSTLVARHTQLAHTVSDSPLAAGPMYQSKANICTAAIAVVLRQLGRTDLPPAATTVLEQAAQKLSRRATALNQKANEVSGTTARAKDVVGRKWISGLFARLFHQPTVRAQRQALARQVDALWNGPDGAALETREIDEQALVEAVLQRAFKAAGLPRRGLDDEMHREMNAVLNMQAWDPIVKQIQLQDGPQTLVAWSEVTPAAALFPSYDGQGVNAHCSAESRHAVNLAQTTLADAHGERLFGAVRHGVLSAFEFVPKGVQKMSDAELAGHALHLVPQHCVMHADGTLDVAATAAMVRAQPALIDGMRALANHNRAEEVVQATLLADPELFRKAQQAAAGHGPVPKLKLLSISLLTPDGVRTGVNGNERLMLRDQVKAWEAVMGKQHLLVQHPQTGEMVALLVDVEPTVMNYGVNQGAVKGFGPIGPGLDMISGWDFTRRLDEAALKDLFGPELTPGSRAGVLGEALTAEEVELASLRADAPPADATDAEAVARRAALLRRERRVTQLRELHAQILQIHTDGSYREAGREPYKMPARLALLGDMLGMKIAFNCKSGKDRTGELDAEIKHLKLQMELTGHVPHYERERSREEVAHFHEVVTHSGNFEMQRLNTGWAGFKLKGVPELYEQFGASGKDDPLTQNFLGLSAHTAS